MFAQVEIFELWCIFRWMLNPAGGIFALLLMWTPLNAAPILGNLLLRGRGPSDFHGSTQVGIWVVKRRPQAGWVGKRPVKCDRRPRLFNPLWRMAPRTGYPRVLWSTQSALIDIVGASWSEASSDQGSCSYRGWLSFSVMSEWLNLSCVAEGVRPQTNKTFLLRTDDGYDFR